MKALKFDQLGLPEDVVTLREVDRPSPGAGEVLVRVVSSPIIPGDALFTQGLYPEPVRPNFPAEGAGNYGVGFVEAVGDQVDLPIGALVAVTHKGLWAEYAVAPIAKVIRLPDNFRPDLGAEFMNLITAWDLLDRSGVQKGQWLVVTAGHATVSTILSQFAEAVGVKVLAVVRKRREAIDPRQYGAQHVLALDTTANVRERILEITGGGAHGLIECVGGPGLSDLAATLHFGARIVIYGGFDPAPFQLHNLDILLKGLEIHSYVYRYFFDGPGAADEARVRQILALADSLDLKIPVGGRYPLDRYAEALKAEDSAGRKSFVMA